MTGSVKPPTKENPVSDSGASGKSSGVVTRAGTTEVRVAPKVVEDLTILDAEPLPQRPRLRVSCASLTGSRPTSPRLIPLASMEEGGWRIPVMTDAFAMHNRAIRVLQANLNHARQAQDLFIHTLAERDCGLGIMAEPYQVPSGHPCWAVDSTGLVAITWRVTPAAPPCSFRGAGPGRDG